MKKVFIIVAAAMTAFSAAAQRPDTTSTVIGKKLNFEAPLFGVTVKNVKPTWSLVLFGEVNLGYSYALNVPKVYITPDVTTPTGEKIPNGPATAAIGLRPGGIYGDFSVLELRLRPWRNGNLFYMALNAGFETHFLPKGSLFDLNNRPVRVGIVGRGIGHFQGTYSEQFLSLLIGYEREVGDWSFGLQLLPGLGCSIYKNAYESNYPHLLSDNIVLQHGEYPFRRDIALGDGFLRLGAKASVWYRDFGVFVSVRSGKIEKFYFTGWPKYTTISAGLSIRY